MDYSLTFARHFARLSWLMLNEGTAFDAQIATLRSLVNASRDGAVTIGTQDWRLMANGQPLPDRFTGTQDLVAQLIGHSVSALKVSQGASPADLLLAVKVLASEAVPGDGGHNVLSRLAALDSRTVLLEIERGGAVPAARPAADGPLRVATTPTGLDQHPDSGIIAITASEELYGAASLAAPSEFLPPMRDESHVPFVQHVPLPGVDEPIDPGVMNMLEGLEAMGGDVSRLGAFDDKLPPPPPPANPDDEPQIMRGTDPDQMTHVFTAGATPKGTMVKMFEALDAAPNSAAAARQLDALVKLGTESARKERMDMVADVFHGIVKREAQVEDKTIKKQFAMSIRRLSTPNVLQSLVELLPRRRENYEQYMAVFEKAEDAGVEALVEALVSAPSITDRRVYYDALLRLRSGIRTLMFMLGDPRWYVVRNAAELLGEMKSAEAEPELTKLLQHRDDRVRTAAASAIAKLGGQAAVKGIRDTFRDGDVPDKRPGHEGGSVNSLIRAVDKEEDSRVQMAILAALGQLGTPAAIEKLHDIARSDKKLLARSRAVSVRVAAVHALGDVKNNVALQSLQSLLRDKEKAVRGAASWVIMGRRRESGQWPEESGLPSEE